MVHFPSKLVHDDAMDALAYLVQLAEGRVFQNWGEISSGSYWSPMDSDLGV